jgi:uncharacterized protein YbaR (Trm112 family)
MKKHLLDILACPIDKSYPLELHELNTRKEYEDGTNGEKEELVIEEGILFCNQCSRFYPIIDEIPIMLPDELRDRDKDLKFLERWRDRIPNRIIRDPRPY